MKTSVQALGIIMDGNRRWAVEQGLAKTKGHEVGLDKLISCIKWCNEAGIKHVAFYAFSTENWKRSKKEVEALMQLLRYMLTEKKQEILQEDVRVRFVGQLGKLPKQIQHLIQEVEQETKHHKKTAWVCMSYGGRAELAHAAARVSGKVTEDKLESQLWTADMPDLDMVIRTGGNHRLSNFLLWKSAYAELYFTKTKWPAFSKRDFTRALGWYEKNITINKGK